MALTRAHSCLWSITYLVDKLQILLWLQVNSFQAPIVRACTYVSTFPVGFSQHLLSSRLHLRIPRIIRHLCSKHQHFHLHRRSFRTKNVETSLRPPVYLYLAVFAECFLADGFAGGWDRRVFEFKARPHLSNKTRLYVAGVCLWCGRSFTYRRQIPGLYFVTGFALSVCIVVFLAFHIFRDRFSRWFLFRVRRRQRESRYGGVMLKCDSVLGVFTTKKNTSTFLCD